MISKREFRDGWFREIFPWRHLIKTKCLFDLFIVFLYGDQLTWDHILYLVIFQVQSTNQPCFVSEILLCEWNDLIPNGAGTQYLHFRSTWYLAWSNTDWSRNSVFTLPEHLIPGMIWYLLEQKLSIHTPGAPDTWNDLIPTGAGTQFLPFRSTWYLEWSDTYWSMSSVLTLPEHLISGAPDIWNDMIPTGARAQCLPFLST